MFGLHMPELIIVLVIALLVFGPKKLPEMGSAIGKSIKEFRKGVNELSVPKDIDKLPDTQVQAPNVSDADFNKLLSGNILGGTVNADLQAAELHKND
jgi:sec-independent protein translocase protein TatA